MDVAMRLKTDRWLIRSEKEKCRSLNRELTGRPWALVNRYNHPHLELGSASRDVETAKFHKEPRPATADVAFPVD